MAEAADERFGISSVLRLISLFPLGPTAGHPIAVLVLVAGRGCEAEIKFGVTSALEGVL
jgi:hypothetical protein